LKISILIHNLNRASALERCLSSVAKQSYRPLEVIILDAGSNDSSKDVIGRAIKIMRQAKIEVRTLDCPPMGVPESRNFAARKASGSLLCAIDNDACFIESNSLGQIVELFRLQPRLGIVSFRVLKGDTSEMDSYAWVFRRPMRVWFNRQFRTFTFAGTGFCVRANAFKEVGGFWEQLKYSREEEELSLRFLDKGYELLYSPDIVIRHYFDPQGRSSVAQRRFIELKNGILIFWRRMPMPLALLGIVGRIFTMSLKMVVRERTVPLNLLKAIPEATREWRQFRLHRVPVTYKTVWKYASLHFT
jgi:GT2 family glycosyltransferase